MRTILFILMLLSFSATAQEPKVSFELASGVVIPFTGRMAGAVQVSAALTLWRERERE
jgi:hypothetical protein